MVKTHSAATQGCHAQRVPSWRALSNKSTDTESSGTVSHHPQWTWCSYPCRHIVLHRNGAGPRWNAEKGEPLVSLEAVAKIVGYDIGEGQTKLVHACSLVPFRPSVSPLSPPRGDRHTPHSQKAYHYHGLERRVEDDIPLQRSKLQVTSPPPLHSSLSLRV